MIKKIIFFVILAAALTFGINFYLSLDDLAPCDANPSGAANICQKADVIVAISGGNTAERVREAVKLFNDGWGTYLLFSGAAVDKTGPSNAESMKQIAIEMGVPAESIYIEEHADTTKQNAVDSQEILSQLNAKRIILVTSGYHQRRASLEFQKYSGDIMVVNHSTSTDSDWSVVWYLTPRGWWLAVNELVRIAMFYIVGA